MSCVPFDFQLPTRIVFGVDTVDRLGALAHGLGARRVLVVSDRGVVGAGLTQRGLDSLHASGLATGLFDQVHENPSTDDVAAGVSAARAFTPDLLVGFGGGSSIDCAKGVNFLYTNGGQMTDYWGAGKAREPMLPMIAVPTTAGTGSEVQSYALISDAQTHVKMACGDKRAACRVAILDPRLTVTQPPQVAALTGIDALAHALESHVTTRSNPLSRLFSGEAWRLLAANVGRVLDEPTDLDARGAMQLGACFAGLAIENSMLGAAHGLANPLTAHYGITHGHAVSLMLPHVIRFNAEVVSPAYGELMAHCHSLDLGSSVARRAPAGFWATGGEDPPGPGGPHWEDADAGDGLARFMSSLLVRTGLAVRLAACGVEESALPDLADEAARQWTTSFNPRPVDAAALLNLYRQAF